MMVMCVLRVGQIMGNDLVRVREAAVLVGRSKVNIYKWIRKGLLQTVVVKEPRAVVGNLFVSRAELLDVASTIWQGKRTDRDVVQVSPDEREPVIRRSPVKSVMEFEDWQLEVARRVLNK